MGQKTKKVVSIILLTFIVVVSAMTGSWADSFSTTLPEGWSLLSLPLMSETGTLSSSTGIEDCQFNAFSGNTLSDGMIVPEVSGGEGFWVNCPTEREITVQGNSLTEEYVDIPLEEGWNLIGVPFATSVAWSNDITVGSVPLENTEMFNVGLYEYSSEENMYYNATDAMEPWKGYWVRSPAVSTMRIANPMARPPASEGWMLLVYMAADNDLEPDAKTDLEEMKSVTDSDFVKIVVQHDGPTETAKRLEVKNGEVIELADIGEVNMGSEQVFSDFISWAKQNFNYEKTMLIIWDHGSGWDVWNIGGGASRKANFIATDITDGGALDVYQIRNALSSNNYIPDIIGFDACNMANMEIFYELRNNASYLIASQVLEPGNGWNYDELISGLIDAPDTSSLDASKLVVDTYMDEYISGSDPITLSVIDASELENLKNKIDAFSDAVVASETVENIVAKFPESRTNPVTPDRDLLTFVSNFTTQEAQNVATAFNTSVIYNRTILSSDTAGISIYLPQPQLYEVGVITYGLYSNANLQFVTENSGWHGLIKKLYDFASANAILLNELVGSFRVTVDWDKETDLSLCVWEPNILDPENSLRSCTENITSYFGFFSSDSSDTGEMHEMWYSNNKVLMGNYAFGIAYEDELSAEVETQVTFNFVDTLYPSNNVTITATMSQQTLFWSPGYFNMSANSFVSN